MGASRRVSGLQFYERQVAYLQADDVEGLIDRHYREDALLVGFGGRSADDGELKEYFRRYLQRLGQLELVSTDNFAETGDTIFLEATVRRRWVSRACTTPWSCGRARSPTTSPA